MKEVEDFLTKYKLNGAEKKFVVGFSGGRDSLCLLDVLNKCGLKLVACHLNHGWRGAESDKEEENCRIFCEKNNIEFYTERLCDCEPSETLAREKRYEFFERCVDKFSADGIFTAHTKTDNAETLIYRIAKGTGINGLCGIPAVRGNIYRPMLEISRDEVTKYCVDNGLAYEDDSSNEDTKFKRNFIRKEIMPRLSEINFSVENALNNLSQVACDETKIVDEYLGLIKKDLSVDDKFLTEKYRKLSDEVKRKLIYDLLVANDIDYDYEKVLYIFDFLEQKNASRMSLSNDLFLSVNGKYIRVWNIVPKADFTIKIDKEGVYEIPDTDFCFIIEKFEGKIQKFPNDDELMAYIDVDNVDFTLRTRRDGDIISPLGLNGTMKLKKYLSGRGVEFYEKDKIVLFCDSAEVLWVPSFGLSDKIKVVNSPSHVIKLAEKE